MIRIFFFFLFFSLIQQAWAFQPFQSHLSDSTIKIAPGPQYKRSFIHNILFGPHYRHLWTEPIEVKVLNIKDIGDSVFVVKRGGGQQTFNLRLEDKNGKQYVIRSVDKDQQYLVPEEYRSKLVNFYLRDQASAMNPYASLTIPPMAKAAGILHTSPRLYYVPYIEEFGEYASLFEGMMVNLEEYPGDEWAHQENFGNSDKIIKSKKLLKKRFKSHNIKIDERLYAKSRLFDIWVGDWDRHIKQWMWAEKNINGIKHYKPIPRDRDIVFFRFNDGFLTYLVSRWWGLPKLQTFDYYFGDIRGMLSNSIYNDNLFLLSLEEKDWLEIADSLRLSLSDEVIENAIRLWPEVIYKKEGESTIKKLKVRRAQLDEAAKEFYRQINRRVNIVGTDEDERFTIERIDNRYTLVSISEHNDPEKVLFQRRFDNRDTKTICIYGLKGEDHFLVKGKTNKGVRLNIFGGDGKDTIIDNSNVKRPGRYTRIYDDPAENIIDYGTGAKRGKLNKKNKLEYPRLDKRLE